MACDLAYDFADRIDDLRLFAADLILGVLVFDRLICHVCHNLNLLL